MKRRNLLLGLIPVGFLPNIAREGDVPGPSDADIQALYERVDGLQRQLDYKNVANSPFQRSGDYAYGSVLDRQTGTVDVTNTAAETTLYSFLLAPNTLYNNRSVRLQMYGDLLRNLGAAEDYDIRFKLGGTTMLTKSVTSVAASPTRGYWHWDLLLSADNSLAAQQCFLEQGQNPLLPTSDNIGAAAEDSLQPLALAVTVDWLTASANLSWRRQFASLELI